MPISCNGTLNHLSLPTSNPPATAAFFARHFGCEIVAEGDSVLLKRDGFDIVLDKVESKADWPRSFHYGFELPTVLRVRAMHEAFQAAGVFMETVVFNNPRGSRLFCRTPDSVLIEVNTREDNRTAGVSCSDPGHS